MRQRFLRKPESRRRNRHGRLNSAAEGAWSVPRPRGLALPRAKIVAALLLSLFAAALVVFFNADLFYVFDFELEGARYLTRGEVERASGIAGYNIFFVDPRAVERALLKLPEVKSARVTTDWPNRVTIRIEERQPMLVWQRGAETNWVDASGIVLRARASLALPTLRDLDQSPVKPGARAPAAPLEAWWAFRDAWAEGPRAVEWSAQRGLAFTDERGWKIYLGGAEDMPGKLAVYRALVAQLVARNARIRFIDLGKGNPYFQ